MRQVDTRGVSECHPQDAHHETSLLPRHASHVRLGLNEAEALRQAVRTSSRSPAFAFLAVVPCALLPQLNEDEEGGDTRISSFFCLPIAILRALSPQLNDEEALSQAAHNGHVRTARAILEHSCALRLRQHRRQQALSAHLVQPAAQQEEEKEEYKEEESDANGA